MKHSNVNIKLISLVKQKGVALVVALLMIMVITVAGVTAMRLAGNAEAQAGNRRENEVAFQAAEAALKYCELRLKLFNAKVDSGANQQGLFSAYYDINLLTPDRATNGKYYWEDNSIWYDITKYSQYVTPNNAPYTASVSPPRCLIESYTLEPDVTQENVEFVPAYRITARGVGRRGSDTNPQAKVYLQTLLRM